MAVIDLLIGALILLVVGAAVTALLAKRRAMCGYVAFLFVAVASVWVGVAAFHVLSTGSPIAGAPVLTIAPLNSSLVFTVDGLSAVFLLITSLIAVCTTLFSVRYMLVDERYSLVRYYPILLLFFASVISVVSVRNMLFFLVFWEFMTLASYVLVVFETDNADARRAGLQYFIATHIATGGILLATILLYTNAPVKSFEFEALLESTRALMATSPALIHLILALFVIGFATKAGILPFGFWLPNAHPVAPSPFSAVLSGCMVKIGVYGVLVVFTSLTPLSHFTTVWGVWIAVLGTVSIFVASLTALQQTDSKRLLAFSTIGQMGYIWLALGVGLALLRISPAVAVVALMAGLFHLVNHACFKSLLFLNAGAALYRTGTRDMDKAGGLMRIMPVTAVTAIIAALAISGIPGLNGFASKWLIFESGIVGGFEIPLLVFLVVVAIFISAVTLAYYMKFLGMVFVGKLHIGQEVERREVPVSMLVPQVLMAIPCVAFGVLPMLALKYLYVAANGILPAGYSPAFASLFGSSPLAVNLSLSGLRSGAWGPVAILVAFVGCLVLGYLISRMGAAQTREVPMWLCGEEHDFSEVRYPVHSFLLTFNRYFAKLYPPIPVPRLPRPTAILKLLDIDRWLYYPGLRWGERIIRVISATHAGFPQLYVLWMIVGAALAVIVLFSMGGGP